MNPRTENREPRTQNPEPRTQNENAERRTPLALKFLKITADAAAVCDSIAARINIRGGHAITNGACVRARRSCRSRREGRPEGLRYVWRRPHFRSAALEGCCGHFRSAALEGCRGSRQGKAPRVVPRGEVRS